MPLLENDLPDIRHRVLSMLMDTVETFERLHAEAETLFGEDAARIRAAIDECLDDFVRKPQSAGELHPESVIYRASAAQLQRCGFYGSQLDLKESQVRRVNGNLRQVLVNPIVRPWRTAFLKWIDVINNFMGSLVSGIGIGEALKELKDCLRDQIDDET